MRWRPLEEPPCEQGEASFDWPRRARSDLAQGELSTPHLSQITPLCFFHPLVLARTAIPSSVRAKNLVAKEAVALGLERAVVDGLRLFTSAVRPGTKFFKLARLMRMESKSAIKLAAIIRALDNKVVSLPSPAFAGAEVRSASLKTLGPAENPNYRKLNSTVCL